MEHLFALNFFEHITFYVFGIVSTRSRIIFRSQNSCRFLSLSYGFLSLSNGFLNLIFFLLGHSYWAQLFGSQIFSLFYRRLLSSELSQLSLLEFLKDKRVDLSKIYLKSVHLDDQEQYSYPLVFVCDITSRNKFHKVGLYFHLEKVCLKFRVKLRAELPVFDINVRFLDIVHHLEWIRFRAVFFLTIEQYT